MHRKKGQEPNAGSLLPTLLPPHRVGHLRALKEQKLSKDCKALHKQQVTCWHVSLAHA